MEAPMKLGAGENVRLKIPNKIRAISPITKKPKILNEKSDGPKKN